MLSSLDLAGRGRARWAIRWKAALNAFAITFDGRINPSINHGTPDGTDTEDRT